MHLESLFILHLPKNRKRVELPREVGIMSFFLDTCQRGIWVFHAEAQSFHRMVRNIKDFSEFEVFQGPQAYLFLLRVVCGLESKVIGETDIFGQFKEAWKRFSDQNKQLSLDLVPWMQRIFEDAKEVRSQYLQKIGGSSYGSLVRKWLKHKQLQISPSCSVLLLGAGQLAQSVAPYLIDSELWVSNRNRENLLNFYEKVTRLPQAKMRLIEGLDQEKIAWQKASCIVICTPVDEYRESLRLDWFTQGGIDQRFVIHLGGNRAKCSHWRKIPGFSCLDDLFLLQNELDSVRSVQIARAEKACENRAKLRYLGGSISIPHGWEDLPCFV